MAAAAAAMAAAAAVVDAAAAAAAAMAAVAAAAAASVTSSPSTTIPLALAARVLRGRFAYGASRRATRMAKVAHSDTTRFPSATMSKYSATWRGAARSHASRAARAASGMYIRAVHSS